MDALIGYTGFVGSNLLRAHAFGALYSSVNIAEARNGSYDLLICAGVRAEKWIADRNEEGDRANIDALLDVLGTIKASDAVLISTTDVYADTRGRTENDASDVATNRPYGRNRALLEQRFKGLFPNALIVRLPGLFGPGLKKNVVHDLVKNHEVEKINTDGVHQYYDITRLWTDIGKARTAGIRMLNISTPPINVEDLCRTVFGVRYVNRSPNAANYDMRSIHSKLWGREDGYLYSSEEVLADMMAFVRDHPDRRPLSLPTVE